MEYKLQDNTIKLGSMMGIDNRIAFFDVFNGTDNTQIKELENFNKMVSGKKSMIDVGCQYGPFSLSFSKINPSASVYAIDGGINPYLTIYQSKMLNKFKDFNVFNFLIGDYDGTVPCHSESHQALALNGGSDEKLMMKIDTLVQLYNIKPDVIKIDIEGCEYKALTGGYETIMEFRPLLFMEIHPNFLLNYGHSVNDIFNFFKKIDYRVLDDNLNYIDDYLLTLKNEKTDSNRTIWVPSEYKK